MFLRAADIVERRAGEITALLAAEIGCAAAFADFQILTATRLLRQAANWATCPPGRSSAGSPPARRRCPPATRQPRGR